MLKAFILGATLLALIFSSCKKDGGDSQQTDIDSLGIGWSKQNIPNETFISDIFFVNYTGFLLGLNKIHKSIDGGNKWQEAYVPGNTTINLAMDTDENCIVTTSDTKIYVSLKSKSGLDSVSLSDDIVDAFFVNNICYGIGTNLWKSTDQGLHWEMLHDFGAMDIARSLYFATESIGWVKTENGVYKTIDGGVNWDKQNIDGFNFQSTASFFFWDQDNGYVIDLVNLYKTTDGGNTWSKVYKFEPDYHDLHFVSKNTGYLGSNNELFKTTDGGMTWTREVKLAEGIKFVELHFISENRGWAACNKNGTILSYSK